MDQLSVKLTSKILRAYTVIATVSTPKIAKCLLIESHLFVEKKLPRNRPVTYCICTHCGKVLPRTSFSDNQGRKNNPNRICIACGIRSNTYTSCAPPRVDKILRLPCKRCKTASMSLDTWQKRILRTELYFDIPRRDPHCEKCLELEIGCEVEEYSNLKMKTGKSFQDLVLERLGVEEWAELGTRSPLEIRTRLRAAQDFPKTLQTGYDEIDYYSEGHHFPAVGA